MPNNWKTYKLQKIAVFSYGKMPKKELLGKGIYPTYSGYKYQYKYPEFNCDKKDIIIVARGVGGTGDVKIVKEKCYLTNLSIKIELDKDIVDYRYFYFQYFLNTLRYLDSGSAQSQITINDLNRLEINLPPLQEQQSIASILSALDDKIENNLAINKTLEEMAMALYKHWFVDSVTDDWEKCNLKDLIEIKGGFSYKGEFIGKGNSLLLGMGCVSFSDRFVSTGARLYSGECPENHYVEPGEIVLATRQQSDNLPILGQPAIIPKYLSGNKIIVGTNLYRVKNKSELSNSLLFQLLKSKEYIEHVLANASGTTVKMITKDVIELYKLAIPPKHLITNYNEKITAISEKIEQNTIENQSLTQLRDTLLPKLISGEVRLKEFREN